MALEEIIGGPFEIWIAEPGTVETEVAAVPGAGWSLLGLGGDQNISEDGIAINHEQTVDLWRPLGLTVAKKAFRSEEDFSIEFMVADLRADTYAHFMAKDPATEVTTVAPGVGTVGTKTLSFYRGFFMRQVALLIRGDGQSPESDAENVVYNSQWWIPRAVQLGSGPITIVKNDAQMLQFGYQPLWDTTDGIGHFTYQYAAATP